MTELRIDGVYLARTTRGPEDWPDQATVYAVEPDGFVRFRYITEDGWSGKDGLAQDEFRAKYPILKEPGR